MVWFSGRIPSFVSVVGRDGHPDHLLNLVDDFVLLLFAIFLVVGWWLGGGFFYLILLLNGLFFIYDVAIISDVTQI